MILTFFRLPAVTLKWSYWSVHKKAHFLQILMCFQVSFKSEFFCLLVFYIYIVFPFSKEPLEKTNKGTSSCVHVSQPEAVASLCVVACQVAFGWSVTFNTLLLFITISLFWKWASVHSSCIVPYSPQSKSLVNVCHFSNMFSPFHLLSCIVHPQKSIWLLLSLPC